MAYPEDGAVVTQIKLLKARYFRAIDTKDWALLRDQLTDDLVADFRESAGVADDRLLTHGADAFVASVQATLAGVTTVHHGYTPEIMLTGAREAKAIWAMDDRLWVDEGSVLPFRWLRGFGHYHDCYRKARGRWLIASTRLSRIRVESG